MDKVVNIENISYRHMEALYTIEELSQIISTSGDTVIPNGPLLGISIDSRTIQKNEIFWAIKGKNHDGHDFVDVAMQNGASLAVVSKEYAAKHHTDAHPLCGVDDTLSSLYTLARYSRNRTKANVVAITGSLGKTTTKDMVCQFLEPSGSVHSAPLSYNNHIGVPLTLVNMPADVDYAIYEIGTNHPGEIEPLSRLVEPDIAVITCIEPVHIENFQSMQELALEKTAIFSGMKDQGFAVVNGNNAFIPLIREQVIRSNIGGFFRYGHMAIDEVRIIDITENTDSLSLNIEIMGELFSLYLPTMAKHFIYSALAAIAVVYLVGADIEKSIKILSAYEPLAGRGKIRKITVNDKVVTVIDDSYNASPVSMRNGLINFKKITSHRAQKKILVLGEMLELGEESEKYHKMLIEDIHACQADKVFLVGANMLPVWESLDNDCRGCFSHSWKEILTELEKNIDEETYIFIKGSNSSGVYNIAKALC